MKHNCCVLVADDEATIGHFFRSALSDRADVHSATNGPEAIEVLKSQAVDLMFVDLHLSDANGLDFLRTAHQMRRSLVSIVTTGNGTLESAIEAMRRGACDYLQKPFDHQKILEALDRALSFKSLNLAARPNRSEAAQSMPPPINIIAASPQMREILNSAELAAPSDVPILIEGEIGVGKQILARWIHQNSRERNGCFIHFPCAALKDARPGAEHPDWQRFVLRSASSEPARDPITASCSFYIEHVEELPMWAQRQLLQGIEGTWIGSPGYANSGGARVRVIASTQTRLDPAVANLAFSRGLYDVLNLTPLSIPPLRKRPEDIRAIVYHFLDRFCTEQKRDPGPYRRMIAEETWQLILRYGWPGNTRELISLIARALLPNNDRVFERILSHHVSAPATASSCDMLSVPLVGDLRTIEQCVIREVVRRCSGNKAAAARALGMHRRTLYRVLQQS